MGDISIRLANAQDAAEIARLNKLFNEVDLPLIHYVSRLSDPSCMESFILAETEGQVIGFAGLRISPTILYREPHAEITEMFVMEGYRRRGAGRALIEYAEQMARQKGAKEIIVATDFYNHGAQELYRSRGFGHHDITLSKEL